MHERPVSNEESTDHQALLLADMYGSVEDLGNMGSSVHQGIFQRFCAAVPTKAYQKDTKEDELDKEYVLGSVLKSTTARAESTGMDSRSLVRNLLEYACALLYGTMFLVGAFLYGVIRVLETRRYRPLMALSMRKYDETPLKLRVKAFNEIVGTSHTQTSDDQSLHAKIFRISWSYSCLSQFMRNLNFSVTYS